MKLCKQFISLTLVLLFVTATSAAQTAVPNRPKASDSQSLPAKIRRFAPTILTANTARLSAKDRLALRKIIAAAKFFDPLFLQQVWSGNEALEAKLRKDQTPTGRVLLHYFRINDGPWSRLDENQPFIDDVPAKPAHANYYPADMTKDEFNSWVAGLSAD